MSTAEVLSPGSLLVNSHQASQSLSAQLEVFAVPGARNVQGNAFPIGLKLKENTSPSLEEVIKTVNELSRVGVIRELLNEHGVIFFRGLPVRTPNDLSAFSAAFNFVRPHQEIGLSGKRTVKAENVKTASEMPPNAKFHFHNEYARTHHFPELIFFWSEQVPEQGGQTPVLSSLELFDRVNAELPEFVEELASKGVIGRQYYPSKDDPDWKEIGWNWKDSYGFDIVDGDTLETQREKVEALLAREIKATAEWQPNGALHVVQHVPAIRKIKSTGKATFFNGIAGTYGSAKAAGALEPPFKIKNGPGYKLPSSYGDGTSIPSKYLDRLIEMQDEIQFLVPWQPTDIALVNNYTVQHSRSPWIGKRSLLVSLWDDINDFDDYSRSLF